MLILQVFFIPLNRFLDPLLEIVFQRIAGILANLRDVRPTVANIALALRTIKYTRISFQFSQKPYGY